MSAHLGRSIKLYLVDGTPQGVMTAEIMNWTGHVLMGPRTQLPELVQRPEMARTGIYFLTGPDPEVDGKTIVYIGESDNVGKRLIQHNKDESKDFWERACVITSKDQNLTKAHARYLESRLIALSQAAGLASIHNGTSPEYTFLPEADIADMEYFISMVQLILPALGHEFLRSKPHPRHAVNQVGEDQSDSRITASPVFVARSIKHGLVARGQEVGPDFIVFAGSETQPKWIGVDNHSYKNHFDLLISEGKVVVQPDQLKAVFQEDVAFKSPSAASAMVFGRASNGRKEWRLKDTNQTYADWQNAQLSALVD
jgi:predicted GIY-YIG superfamily endonuclease